MPTVILDTVENARVIDSLNGGFQIHRGVIVKDITFAVGESGAEVWQKALTAPFMPVKGSVLSASYPAILTERRLVGIDQHKSTVRGVLIYTSPFQQDGGGGIQYSLTDASQVSHVRSFSSGNGDSLQTWYKSGTAGTVSSPPADSQFKDFQTTKMLPSGAIRATGFATAAQWDAVRINILLAKGKVNSQSWGVYTRAQAYFVGPTTTTFDNGNSFQIQLDFLTTSLEWMVWGEFFDPLGNHPRDSATEANVRGGGGGVLPAVGTQRQHNGITLASQYLETDFNALFSFTP